jgi:hypothetical protein
MVVEVFQRFVGIAKLPTFVTPEGAMSIIVHVKERSSEFSRNRHARADQRRDSPERLTCIRWSKSIVGNH